MTPEVKIIHQLSQNKIFEISSKSEGDLKAWVANGQYLMENPLVKLKNYLKVLLGPQSKCIIQHFLLHMRY